MFDRILAGDCREGKCLTDSLRTIVGKEKFGFQLHGQPGLSCFLFIIILTEMTGKKTRQDS